MGMTPGPSPRRPSIKDPSSLREFLYNYRVHHENMIGVSASTIHTAIDDIEQYLEENSEIDMPSRGLCVYVGPHVEYCKTCDKAGYVHKHPS